MTYKMLSNIHEILSRDELMSLSYGPSISIQINFHIMNEYSGNSNRHIQLQIFVALSNIRILIIPLLRNKKF